MNQLLHIDEFREVLAHYQLSSEAKQTLQDIEMVLLVGPSSSGRNTIINELVKSGDYYFIVSDTTRRPRVNNGIPEQNGREYWFRKEEDMLADLKQGKFLEAAIIHNQQVSGISMRELKKAVEQRKIAIDEIEVVGADNIHRLIPSARFLFVLPPSFDEWMARMNTRGELPESEVRRRLESAVVEIRTALNRDYYTLVVNDTFKHSTKQIDTIIKGGSAAEDQGRAKTIAQELLRDTEEYLNGLA